MAEATCSVDWCERRIHAKAYCQRHYIQWRKTGSPLPTRAPKPCTVDTCRKPAKGHGMCAMHYSRWRRWGDPHVERERPKGERNHNWKGDGAGYVSVHNRIRRAKGKAGAYACVECGGQARQWAYDYADPSELVDEKGLRYSTDPDRYEPMCASCHKVRDLAAREERRMRPEVIFVLVPVLVPVPFMLNATAT